MRCRRIDLASFQILTSENDVRHGPADLPCFNFFFGYLLSTGKGVTRTELRTDTRVTISILPEQPSRNNIKLMEVTSTSSQPFKCFSTGCRASAGYSNSVGTSTDSSMRMVMSPFRRSALVLLCCCVTLPEVHQNVASGKTQAAKGLSRSPRGQPGPGQFRNGNGSA